MIKASYLQKQASKYRELARDEVSLEMRRQLFALASRCDELATTMARWPGPKELARSNQPRPVPPKKLAAAPAPDTTPAAAQLRFADGHRARLVHGFAD